VNAQVSASASATYGQVTLSVNDFIYTTGVPAHCCSAGATAAGSFNDEITFLGGTGPIFENFYLSCPGGTCPTLPAGDPYLSETFVAPSEETFGVPFDISLSISVSDVDNYLDEIPWPGLDGTLTWNLAVVPNIDSTFPLEYTDASGTDYSALDNLHMTFVASTPEPSAVGLTLVGVLAMVIRKHKIG
jgi:hypothetical protein